MGTRWDRNGWTVGASLALAVTAGATGLGSIDASEAATFEPEIIEGCSNLDGQVVHDGVWWSANGALVRVDRVPDRWLSGEPIAGRDGARERVGTGALGTGALGHLDTSDAPNRGVPK